MTLRNLVLSGSLIFCGLAAAAPALADDAATPPSASSEEMGVGEKRYKERINTVARAPRRHDVEYINGRDRTSWGEFTQWYGIRDARPLIARKTLGFHERNPHATRWERVRIVSRGPLRGPAPPK